MRGMALLLVLLALLRCADSVSAFLSINTEAVSSASSAAVKPYLRLREVQRGTTGNPREDGTDLQHIAVSLAHRTNPSVNDILIDSIDHVDSGLYRVAYTPIVSGQYDASITIKGDNISTNLSNGLTIRPARADAIKSTHNASPLVTEGIDETFTIQAIDRYGNELWSELPSKEDEFLVDLKGAPHVCSGRESDAIDHPVDLEYLPEVGDVEADAEYSGSGGLYKASYAPTLAGTHQLSIRLRSVGGLLGTYFRNADFTQPVWGNSDHLLNSHPANIPWCEPDIVECDSTRLDTNVMFDWGFGSPLRVAPNDDDSDDDGDGDDDNNKFPIDSFSAKWVGELKVPATDEYTFYVTLNGQAKLMVGESVLIDTMANPSQSKTVSSETIELVVDTFYPIILEYIHHTDEALIELEWASWNIAEKEAVPSSALYYTRHLGNDGENQGNQNTNNSNRHPSSPFPVEVLPGAIDLTSSPSSDIDVDDHEEDAAIIIDGLNKCVATTECSFVIQTKDSEGNNRYNDGTDPVFVLSMTGRGGWAGDGRVNDDLTYSTKPLEVSPLVSVPLDWQYLDMVEVVHRSNQLTTGSNLLSKGLKRGDHVVVAGQTYTVSSSLDRTFDETTVPLDELIVGPSMPSAALYKTGLGCDTGKHLITYTPQVRGEYALDVRLPPVPEVQRIQIVAPDEGPNSALSTPSGTFVLTYRSSDGDMQTTADISYDANVDELKEALESLSNLSEVELGLDTYSCVVDGDPTRACSWEVTFVGPDLEGDVELLMPNDGDLVGATVVVTELRTGIPARSISGFPRTVTVVPDTIDPAWTTAHGQGLVSATAGVEAEFTIQAKDGAGNDLLSNVDNPDAVFEVTITPEDGDGGAAIDGMVAAEDNGHYRVSYTPIKSGHHAINVVVKSTAGGNAPKHIKKSPFRILVDPAPINATNSVASDSPGVIHYEGLSTGVYDSQTYFSIQLYDEFGNVVPEGPQSEVQIIEMWSLSPLGGTFGISYGSNMVTLPAGAGIAKVERAIQTLPGIGDVTVTTNTAKDTVAASDGRTVAVTTGLDTLVPSQRLDDEFSVGDWIRIGNRDDGPVFTIVGMSTATPFTVVLSSAYTGESDSAAAIYGQSLHGPPFGFQYIVSFDSTVGDIKSLEVDGENLDSGDDETTISVTSCDHNVYQTIETHADESDSEDPGALPSISGTFNLSYKGHRTPGLSASIDAASLEAIVEETFSSMDGGIRKVTVLGEVDLERGAKRWNVRLDDYDGDDPPSLLFAEGHLLSSGSITVTAVCPIASYGDSLLEVPSHSGRSGQEFNIALIGVGEQGSDENHQSSIVHGQAHYVANGLYEALYKSPRVGEYKLHIDTALSGGLYGRYYNNRWLFGSPIEERVDETIDFVWNDTHPVNEAIGNEFISVRWTGYIKAAFNEVYSFRMRVNDGARLWIGDEVIIDEFDSIVEKTDEEVEMYHEYQGNTSMPLETTRLIAIKIEFQQNRGDAAVRLEWSSETQPWSVVESYRLFHEGQSVDESPYIVHTRPIPPTEPRNCSATVVGAKSIQVHWLGPEDDGGEDVQSYRVVVQDIEASFVVFDETLLAQDMVDMMPMVSSDDDTGSISSMYSLDVGDDNKETRVESAESIPLLVAGKQYGVQVSAGNSQDDHGPFCRQVLVTPMSEPMAVKAVLLDRHPTSPTSLIVSFDPVVEERTNGSEVSHYRIEWSTDASFGVTGDSTINVIVQEATLLSLSQYDDNFLLYEIQELEPGQEYHVRVTAINAVGVGPPSLMPALLAPGSEPEPIEQNRFMLRIIEASGDYDGPDDDTSVVTVGESSTSLLASWPIHPIHDDNGFAVEKYVLEYFVATEDAQSSSAMEPTRINTIEIDADASNCTLTGLSPGQPISARIYAKNVLGLSTATVAIPDELAPPRQPPSEPINVQLSRVGGGGDGGGSSLSVSWDPPTSDGGDAISKYLVEHSTDEDFSPSSTDFGAYTKVDCQDKQRCRHAILGLTEGMSYYVRVFAGNSYGFSRTAISQPKSLAPLNPPDRLDRVNIATDDGNNGQHIVNVSWQRRGDESGSIVSPTTAYKVEWVETNLYQDYTTQRIQASGSFRLSLQGHKTKILAADSSAYKIKQALESLPTIGSAEVFKEDVVVGSGGDEGPTYTSSWLATFPNFRHMDKLQIELGGGDSTETDPAAAVEFVVEAFQGYEVQSVTCERCLDGSAQREQSFRLSYNGNATAALPLSITPSALEAALRDIGVGEVEVSRRTDRNIQGYEWKVTFTSLLGDLPLLRTVVDPHSEVRVYVGELAKGQLPPTTGSSYGSLVVNAREAESKADANGWIHWSVEIPRKRSPYFFQASVSNEVGFGPPMYSTPPTI